MSVDRGCSCICNETLLTNSILRVILGFLIHSFIQPFIHSFFPRSLVCLSVRSFIWLVGWLVVLLQSTSIVASYSGITLHIFALSPGTL